MLFASIFHYTYRYYGNLQGPGVAVTVDDGYDVSKLCTNDGYMMMFNDVACDGLQACDV